MTDSCPHESTLSYRGRITSPPGVTPDFVHPFSLQKYNVICQAVCLPASTIFVLARVYTKTRIMPPLGSEDCTVPEIISLQSNPTN